LLENLYSVTGKVHPFPADPQVSSIALVNRSPALLAEVRNGNFHDLLHLLGSPRSGDTRPLRTVGLRGALERIEVFVTPCGSQDDLRTLADMRDGTVHAAMDDQVETRLLAAFAQYADELLRDLSRDRPGFWGGQLEVVDALLSDASDKAARDLEVKLAQARAYLSQHFGDKPAELLEAVRQLADPGRYGPDQKPGECPICGSMGLLTGTSYLFWAPDVEGEEQELLVPSAFECRVCRLRLTSRIEAEAVGFERWEYEDEL